MGDSKNSEERGPLRPITEFRGLYVFLSNFYPYPITYDGTEYPTVEHAFQCAKTVDLKEKAEVMRSVLPGAARKIGHRITCRADWEEVKRDVMLEILRIKFSPDRLGAMLLATGESPLIEGNTWGDRYWGQSPLGVGENHLGKLLMQIRTEFNDL